MAESIPYKITETEKPHSKNVRFFKKEGFYYENNIRNTKSNVEDTFHIRA